MLSGVAAWYWWPHNKVSYETKIIMLGLLNSPSLIYTLDIFAINAVAIRFDVNVM